MSASIVIEDYLAASTQGSVDKDNSFATKVFTLSNFDDTGVLGWQWVLSDKPAGSSAAITGAATATATITPDVPGTYLIRLLTYTDAAATLFDDADEQCVGIRYAAPHDWRIPAAGETRQFSTGRGWANEVNDILDDARSGLGTGGGGKQTAKIIVGNSPAGDTLADCDFLDLGDGVQLVLALAAAGPDDDVYIRPGTYDLGAGAAVAPIAIPTGVSVRGAGWTQTRIVTKSAADMGAFVLADFASLRDVSITVPVTTGAGSGSTSVVLLDNQVASVERVIVDWTPGYGGPEAANLNILASFGLSAAALGASVRACQVTGAPSLRDLGVVADLCGWKSEPSGSPFSLPERIIDGCVFQGGDIGVLAQAPTRATKCATVQCYSAHFSFSTAGAGGSSANSCSGTFISFTPTDGVFLVDSAVRTIISQCAATNVSGSGVGVGYSFVGAENGVITGNVAYGMATGIDLDATSDNNIVLTNNLPTCTTAVADAGAGNEVAHNI